MSPREYAKSLVGALIAGLTALLPGLDDGLSGSEVLTAVIAALVGLSAVFLVPNVAPAGKAADPALSEQSGRDDGVTDTGLLIVVLLVVLLLVLFGVLR